MIYSSWSYNDRAWISMLFDFFRRFNQIINYNE